MRVPTVDELVEWIEGTTGPDDSPQKIKARLRTSFALGTPREIFEETERNFTSAMILYTKKLTRSRSDGE